MTSLHQIYKCSICGNMTEMVHTGVGTLVCCGKNMDLISENTVQTQDLASPLNEKHIPIVEKNGNQITVKVGLVPHPMTPEHHIEWIEIICKDAIHRISLHPGEVPKATFDITEEIITVRAYCNLHGLWKS